MQKHLCNWKTKFCGINNLVVAPCEHLSPRLQVEFSGVFLTKIAKNTIEIKVSIFSAGLLWIYGTGEVQYILLKYILIIGLHCLGTFAQKPNKKTIHESMKIMLDVICCIFRNMPEQNRWNLQRIHVARYPAWLKQTRWLLRWNEICIGGVTLRLVLSAFCFEEKEWSLIRIFQLCFLTFRCDVGCFPLRQSVHGKQNKT